jgi:hypothetical protein
MSNDQSILIADLKRNNRIHTAEKFEKMSPTRFATWKRGILSRFASEP